MNNKLKTLIEISSIGFVIWVINFFFFQICFVDGNSMQPTLKDGQMLLVQKYNFQVNNNDIVVIKKNNKIIIKRVIGIQKDRISIIDGYVYVNMNKVDDRYIENPGNVIHEITLKENEYFVLGDNRNHSVDSRFDEIGIIEKKNIVGKIVK